MKLRFLVVLFLALALAIACSTLSKDSSFLLTNLDNANKSSALTNQGAAAYDTVLVLNGDYTKADSVREYFLVALRYDPNNARAKQYLDKIDNYRTTVINEKSKTIDRLLAKTKRREDEDYSLILAIQTIASVDPANKEATKLIKDNAAVKTSVVTSYMQKSKDAQAKAVAASNDAAREPLYLEAYDAAIKTLAIAPNDSAVLKQRDAILIEIVKIFSRHQANQAKLVGAGKLDDAKAELDVMTNLDSKLGHTHDVAIEDATYNLYFQWGKAQIAKNALQDANAKLDIALGIKETEEARALKNKIAGQAASLNQDAAFDAAVAGIDKLLGSGDLSGANKQIAAAAKLTKDKTKLALLDPRRAKIQATLADMYAKGVAAYRAEDYKAAIEQLGVIVKVDANYEQASDYLSKAQDKQKLLDQYK